MASHFHSSKFEQNSKQNTHARIDQKEHLIYAKDEHTHYY